MCVCVSIFSSPEISKLKQRVMHFLILFYTPALVDSFSLESNQRHVPSSLQDSSQFIIIIIVIIISSSSSSCSSSIPGTFSAPALTVSLSLESE